MLIKKILLFVLSVLLVSTLFAQGKSDRKKEPVHELGLNVTSLLTDLLGNNNRVETGDYLISYKKLNGNTAFRVGVTANFSIKKEDNFNFNNNLTNQNFQLRMGKEWRHSIAPKLEYYFGADGIMGTKLEQSSASISGGVIIQSNRLITLGGGPVLGFQYALFERLLLGTEGALYAALSRNKIDFQTFNVSSGQIPSKKSDGLDIQTHLPKFLFLILKF